MNIKVFDQLQDGLVDVAWQLYHEAFQELNALTVERHLMYRTEFDDVMLDRRVQKYLCLDDDGVLCGLSTYTNDLDANPLISPQYFERRWPQHYAEKRIWYVLFVAVARNGRASNAFTALVEAMYREAAPHDPIIGLDFCRYNDDVHHMSRVIELMMHRIAGSVRAECMDEQSYWLYEFPAAA